VALCLLAHAVIDAGSCVVSSGIDVVASVAGTRPRGPLGDLEAYFYQLAISLLIALSASESPIQCSSEAAITVKKLTLLGNLAGTNKDPSVTLL
jgi:hypothetical protein